MKNKHHTDRQIAQQKIHKRKNTFDLGSPLVKILLSNKEDAQKVVESIRKSKSDMPSTFSITSESQKLKEERIKKEIKKMKYDIIHQIKKLFR